MLSTHEFLSSISTHIQRIGAVGLLPLVIIQPGGKVLTQKFRTDDWKAMADEALARSQHANVYAPLHLVRNGLASYERGKLPDISAVFGVVIDDDSDKRAVEPPFAPSFELVTSRVPHRNRQLGFLFNRVLSGSEALPIAAMLHAKCGGDHGTKDVVHVWRIPGTLNHPTANKIARGRPQTPQLVEGVWHAGA